CRRCPHARRTWCAPSPSAARTSRSAPSCSSPSAPSRGTSPRSRASSACATASRSRRGPGRTGSPDPTATRVPSPDARRFTTASTDPRVKMESMTASPATAPAPTARRRRRGPVIALVALGVVVLLVVAAEVLLRGLIDDRLRAAEADLPAGVSVERDDTPALWQVATGHARLRVDVAPDALTDLARDATQLPDLEVEAESGTLV